jgi:predicted ribosomally synthesized peptide with nif11-like leader
MPEESAMNEALKAFFVKLEHDVGLQAACTDAVARADLDAIVRLGAESGFTFTVDELKQALESQAAELSEEDLEKVSGGAGGRLSPTAVCITLPGRISIPGGCACAYK